MKYFRIRDKTSGIRNTGRIIKVFLCTCSGACRKEIAAIALEKAKDEEDKAKLIIQVIQLLGNTNILILTVVPLLYSTGKKLFLLPDILLSFCSQFPEILKKLL
jgi:hypothetical protein